MTDVFPVSDSTSDISKLLLEICQLELESKMFLLGAEILLYICWLQVTRASSECEHVQLTSTLRALANNHTHITRLMSIGKSVEGREIWLMLLSDSPETRPLLRPQVKFVGNINGYSGPACYLLLRLIKELVEGYEVEGSLERTLLQRNEIHVILNASPDGYARAMPGSCTSPNGKLNVNGRSLNRNFPYLFEEDDRSSREPETEAIMGWIHGNNFLLSLSLISGASVVIYPFDSIPHQDGEEMPIGPHFTPDNDIFQHLALTYAQNVPGQPWYCSALERDFPQGIINGAAWQPAAGTMMDYNYIQGTFELMVGVDCCRNPKDELLPAIWEQHGQALLRMIEETDAGVRGQVVDAKTLEALPDAVLFTGTHGVPWKTSVHGEFWRPLLPAKHSMTVTKEGYKDKVILFEVSLSKATILRVEMDKLEAYVPSTATSTSTTGTSTASSATPIESSTEMVQPLTVSSSNISLVLSRKTKTFEHTFGSMWDRLTSCSPGKAIDLRVLFLTSLFLASLQNIEFS